MIQFCTTKFFRRVGEDELTAPATAFGECVVGWSRGHSVGCHPMLNGYLHGEVAAAAGFDVPIMCRGEVLVDGHDKCELDCQVWVDQESTVDCVMVVWPLKRFSVFVESDVGARSVRWYRTAGLAHEAMMSSGPEGRKVIGSMRYMIVDARDAVALAYARRCADEVSSLE